MRSPRVAHPRFLDRLLDAFTDGIKRVVPVAVPMDSLDSSTGLAQQGT
jgi:hypothetical protein